MHPLKLGDRRHQADPQRGVACLSCIQGQNWETEEPVRMCASTWISEISLGQWQTWNGIWGLNGSNIYINILILAVELWLSGYMEESFKGESLDTIALFS